jgi:cytochrome c oxidase cbb3-type subunit 3
MNKLFVFGVVFTIALLALTWLAVGGTAGGIGEDYINQLGMLGAVATAVLAIFVALKYIRQMQTDTATGELAEENWDGIGEYKNELPFGWAIIFFGITVWAIWYMLVGYPTQTFSQIGQYNEEVGEYNNKYETKFEAIKNDPALLNEMGQSVFIVNCAPCHGLKGDGMDGTAADLSKRLDAKTIEYTINNGSDKLGGYPLGVMPAGMAQGKDVKEIAQFVAGGMKSNKGRAAYEMACASCHGADGTGMGGMAPNLKAFETALIAKVLDNGKKGGIGVMPSFKHSLNDTQKLAVETYVKNLSEGAN